MPFAPDLDEREKRRLVREGYDAIAQHYFALARSEDGPDAPRRRWTAEVIGRLAPPADVLELGCGAGVPVGQLLLEAGHFYTGVDVSPRQIELAREQLAGAALVCGDAVDLDFPKARYDAVFMLYAMTHVPREHWRSLLERIAEWLRPRGRLLLNVPLNGVPSWIEENFLGSGQTNWTNSHDPNVTRDLMTQAGLVVERAEVIPEVADTSMSWMWLLAMKTG